MKTKLKASYRLFKAQCFHCKKKNAETLTCARCLVAKYCCRECQKADWSTHKVACELNDKDGFTVKIDDTTDHGSVDILTGEVVPKWNGDAPRSNAVGEWFDVKVQIALTCDDLLVYNKERDVLLQVHSTMCDKHEALCDAVRKFTPCEGLKAYFRAKVVEKGTLFISSQQIFVRKW